MPPSKRPTPAVERAFIYCRQSKTDGEGERSISLASQERMLRDLAEERGMVVVGAEVDADIRGWRDESERPGLRNALERARSGDYDALLFYDISRVARDVFLLERLVRDLGRYGVRPVSLKEPQVEDPFYRQILAAIAEKYTRDLSAHSKRGIAEQTRRGVHHGFAPFGYRKVNRANHPADRALTLPDRALVPDNINPERVGIVRELFTRFANGETMSELQADLRARNIHSTRGTHWSLFGLRSLLQNEAYVGDIETGETLTPNAHEPLIDRALFDRVAGMFEPNGRLKRKRKCMASWLEGFLLHECGARAHLISTTGDVPYFRCQHSSEPQPSRAGAWTRCTLRPKSRRHDWLEREVWEIVASDLARIIDPEEAIALADDAYARMAPDALRQRQEIASALQRLDNGLDRAEALYLDGSRTREWLNDYELRQASERATLLRRRDALSPEPDHGAIADAAVILRNISDELHFAQSEDRRAIMARLGVATFGPSGVIMWYSPEIAALIPGAASWLTSVTTDLSPQLLTSIRATCHANAAKFPAP